MTTIYFKPIKINKMKIENLSPNHQVVTVGNNKMLFSYSTCIVLIDENTNKVFLDKIYWDYSKTTGKNRNLFLGEDKKTTQQKINDGIYLLTNLNEK